MKIVKPKVELWKQEEQLQHIVRCARVCYATKDGKNDEALYKALKSNGHLSMFRHHSRYFIIPLTTNVANLLVTFYTGCPYIELEKDKFNLYVSTNSQFVIEHDALFDETDIYEVSPEHFEQTEIGFKHMRYTFNVITQISTSRELNRVSPNNIAEQSTRYCSFNKDKFDNCIAICEPHWYSKLNSAQKEVANIDFRNAEQAYLTRVNGKWTPQDAREFLPLATATECVYTYSINEWRHIIDLRYYGTTGAPHPNAKIIAGMIREKLIGEGHDFE